MPAYLIANIHATSPDGYRGYAEQLGATVDALSGGPQRFRADDEYRPPRARIPVHDGKHGGGGI